MRDKRYRVKELAELAGVTVRTLHHYDHIGLLRPSARTDAGYRLYTRDDLLRLQQILLGRELGMPLETIRRMLTDPELDRLAVLRRHREQLIERGRRHAAMIRAVDAAIAELSGGTTMTEEQLFEGFDPREHEAEARERWGSTPAYAEAARRTARYTKDDWRRIKAEDRALMGRLAELMDQGVKPTDARAVGLAEEHRLHIERWYYPCSPGMHAGLAGMYEADPRFTAAFDKHREGLAAYLARAIRANPARGSDTRDKG